MNWKQIVIAICTVLISAAVASPQESLPIKVKVLAESTDESKEAAKELMGRIGSSSRYALIDEHTFPGLNGSPPSAYINLFVFCTPISKQLSSVVCDAYATYNAIDDKGERRLGGTFAIDTSVREAANRLFNSFVRDSSDEKIKEVRERIEVEYLNIWNAGYSHGRVEACAPAKK